MYEYGMYEANNLLYGIGTAALGIGGAVAIIFGMMECYFGYRLFKIVMGITGFFVGVGIGGTIGVAIISNSGGGGGVVILLALIGGILGALIAVKVYFLGVFLFGLGIGILITLALQSSMPIGIVVGIIFGVLLVIFDRLLIIIATSISGGILLGKGIEMLFNSCELNIPFAVKLLISFACIVTGLYYQFKVNGGLPSIMNAAKVKGKRNATTVPSQHFCQECGAELQQGEEFCSNCGSKVE